MNTEDCKNYADEVSASSPASGAVRDGRYSAYMSNALVCDSVSKKDCVMQLKAMCAADGEKGRCGGIVRDCWLATESHPLGQPLDEAHQLARSSRLPTGSSTLMTYGSQY